MKLCAWRTGGAQTTCPAGYCVSVMSPEPLCSLCSQLRGEGTCRDQGTLLSQAPCAGTLPVRPAEASRSTEELCWFQRTSVSSCWCACQPGVLLSAVLTSKFMSSPLLFPGSSPTSHLSASGLAARRAAQGEEERAVPARGFSQALFSPFGRGLPAGSVSSLPIPGECFCLLLSHLSLPMPEESALAGWSWHLALSPLQVSVWDAQKPVSPSSHLGFCFKISQVNASGGGRCSLEWAPRCPFSSKPAKCLGCCLC